MARPTNDKKDTKIILRTNTETREYVEKKAAEMGCSISDCVRKLIMDSSNVVQNTVVQNNSEEISVLQNKIKELEGQNEGEIDRLTWDLPAEIMDDTEQMGGFYGMTLGEMMTEFNRMLNEGEIAGENGRLSMVLPDWADRIREISRDADYAVDEVSRKVVMMIQRGQI